MDFRVILWCIWYSGCNQPPFLGYFWLLLLFIIMLWCGRQWRYWDYFDRLVASFFWFFLREILLLVGYLTLFQVWNWTQIWGIDQAAVKINIQGRFQDFWCEPHILDFWHWIWFKSISYDFNIKMTVLTTWSYLW